MTSPDNAVDFLADLRRKAVETSGVFWINDRRLAVFEPAAARRVNAENWRDLTMPDRLVDLLRRRQSPPIVWARVRAIWLRQLRLLTTAPHNAELLDRLAAILDRHLGAEVDLVLLAQDLMMGSILPVVLAGVTDREREHLLTDLRHKLIRLISRDTGGRGSRFRLVAAEIRAGLVIRRVLRQRAAGRRPRELDLADPFVDMLDELGMDRAVDVIGGIFAAVGGPPGSAAASLLYAIARYPAWTDRVAEEMRTVPRDDLLTAPTTAAPVSHRFVKEVLRLWSPPLLMARPARKPLDVGEAHLDAGDEYVVSPHLIHRDERHWPDADAFDPDRFLPEAVNCPHTRGTYVPFGWNPRACIGAEIGTIQLMLLCHLLTTRYRIDVADVDRVTMAYRFAPVPLGFTGSLAPR